MGSFTKRRQVSDVGHQLLGLGTVVYIPIFILEVRIRLLHHVRHLFVRLQVIRVKFGFGRRSISMWEYDWLWCRSGGVQRWHDSVGLWYRWI